MKVRISHSFASDFNDRYILFDASNPDRHKCQQRLICNDMKLVNGQRCDAESELYDKSVMYFQARRSLIKVVNCQSIEPVCTLPDYVGNLDYQATLLEDVLEIHYNEITYYGVLQGFTETMDIEGRYVDAVRIRVEGDDYDSVFPLYAVVDYCGEKEEPILCIICHEPGDYCQGHGSEERDEFGDCPMCDDDTYNCTGHSSSEISDFNESLRVKMI